MGGLIIPPKNTENALSWDIPTYKLDNINHMNIGESSVVRFVGLYMRWIVQVRYNHI